MTGLPDDRLREAHAMPIAEVAARLELGNLRRVSDEMVGPCPQCGGNDRFSISLTKNLFNCRICAVGGDQVALVRHALGLDFPGALNFLCGPAQGLTDAERAERRRKAEKSQAEQDRIAAKRRAEAVAAARRIWGATVPAEGTIVRDYLALRGIPPHLLARMPDCLRLERRAPLMIADASSRSGWREVHCGPAMVAGIMTQDGWVDAVHRTWIDLDQPGGKVRLPNPLKPDEMVPAKKVFGSKRGGAIRLRSPRDATSLVMGEGIETTLSALIAEQRPFEAAYWAGVDLGNMSGRMARVPGTRSSGIPDMTDDRAFVPPPQIRQLIFIQDGDSDPTSTRARLLAGLRRCMAIRPDLRGFIVHAGAGRDLNDVLLGGGAEGVEP